MGTIIPQSTAKPATWLFTIQAFIVPRKESHVRTGFKYILKWGKHATISAYKSTLSTDDMQTKVVCLEFFWVCVCVKIKVPRTCNYYSFTMLHQVAMYTEDGGEEHCLQVFAYICLCRKGTLLDMFLDMTFLSQLT